MDKITVVLDENQALKDLAYDIEIEFSRGGVQFVPTSVLLTVKDPNGTAQIEDEIPSVSGGGTITYELATTYTGTLWENAILELDYTDENGNEQRETLFFDVVLNILKNVVVDSDLTDYEPDLGSHRWGAQTSFTEQIRKAFEQIKRDVKDRGKRPAMLIDGVQVKELVIYKTLAIICFAFAKDAEEDIWWFKYQKWADMYDTGFSKLLIKYDENESGTIEEDEKDIAVSTITFNR